MIQFPFLIPGLPELKKYMSGNHIAMEITFKNGVKEGLTKTFYPGGKVSRTLWYENGLREDSAKWYFEEGQLFRTTPYKRDTIDGHSETVFQEWKAKSQDRLQKGIAELSSLRSLIWREERSAVIPI